MKKLTILLLIVLACIQLSSCEDRLNPDCIEGKVLGFERCLDVFLIQILSGNLSGDSVIFSIEDFKM